MGQMFTVEEAAARLNKSPHTLRWWRTRGLGEGPKSGKLGRRIMYREEDLDAWVAKQFADDQPIVRAAAG